MDYKVRSPYTQKMQIKHLIISFVLISSGLHAATIQIASDLLNEFNNRTEGNVFIIPDPAWVVAPPGAGWIYDQIATDPGNSNGHPRVIFTETFFLPGTINAGSLKIWAVDSALVRLDGACDGPLTCQPLEFGEIDLSGLSQGEHVLTFSVHHQGGNASGLLYSGSVSSTGSIEAA